MLLMIFCTPLSCQDNTQLTKSFTPAVVLDSLGLLDEAERNVRQALEINRSLHAADGEAVHRNLHTLATILMRQPSRKQEAQSCYEECRRVAAKLGRKRAEIAVLKILETLETETGAQNLRRVLAFKQLGKQVANEMGKCSRTCDSFHMDKAVGLCDAYLYRISPLIEGTSTNGCTSDPAIDEFRARTLHMRAQIKDMKAEPRFCSKSESCDSTASASETQVHCSISDDDGVMPAQQSAEDDVRSAMGLYVSLGGPNTREVMKCFSMLARILGRTNEADEGGEPREESENVARCAEKTYMFCCLFMLLCVAEISFSGRCCMRYLGGEFLVVVGLAVVFYYEFLCFLSCAPAGVVWVMMDPEGCDTRWLFYARLCVTVLTCSLTSMQPSDFAAYIQ
jgi:hypothetical protein